MPNFVNPYTFIPLGRRRQSDAGSESLTGVISCRLTAMTPIIIPDGKVLTIGDLNEQNRDINYVNPCFKVGGNPVIPGSSIRGPIRSMYEALTNSCMRINNTQLSSAGGRKLPGLLRWSKEEQCYVLYTAKRYRVTDVTMRQHTTGNGKSVDWVTGDRVYITTGPEEDNNEYRESKGVVASISEEQEDGSEVGYYLRVNQMGGRTANSPSVFVEDTRVAQPVDPKYVEALKENVRQYVANAKEQSTYQKQYQECLDTLDDGGVLPVWYSYEKLEGGSYAFHFAWAQLSRSVYPKWTGDFVKGLGLQPCSDPEGPLCPACELFGFVSQEGEGARAGRLRFSDAIAEGDVETGTYTLPPLLGPRIHATEFYLRNTIRGHGDSFTPMTPGTELSGRKVYWNLRDGIREVYVPMGVVPEDENRFASRVEAIGPGASFHFAVYFDGVSKQQLNEIVYVLTLGREWPAGNGDGERWHKIGHGKPVGAGSALIEVEHVSVRMSDGTVYAIVPWDEVRMELGSEGKRGTVLYRMGHTHPVREATSPLGHGQSVDYPRKVAGGSVYEWFVGNHVVSGNRGDTIVRYRQVLPPIQSKTQELSMGRPKSPTRGTIESLTTRSNYWYGFIKPDSGGKRIYFYSGENSHITDPAIFGNPAEGARVTYEARDCKDRQGKPQKHAFKVSPEKTATI